ncbi:MAG: CBS domain-containing protein [Cellvibrionaceae bacterium]
MSFQIFEQGRRIETPWKDSFPSRQVNRLEKTAGLTRISQQQDAVESDKQDTSDPQISEYQRQQIADDGDTRKRIYRADQIMVSPVHTLSPSQSLDQAWAVFAELKIRHLPVVDAQGQVQGLVSQRRLLKMTSSLAGPSMARSKEGMSSAPSGASPVSAIMRRRVLTATPDTNLRELTKVMLERHVGSLLILSDPDQQLSGIITRSDVLKAVSHQVPLELWA